MTMHSVDIDCSLGYNVLSPAEFVVQIQAAFHPWQKIVKESLEVTGIAPELFVDHTGLNRLFRFSASKGPVEVFYRATVEVDMPYRDPNAQEMSISELPSDILHYLLPSRYCESDVIGAMARRTFGHLPRGFERVEAICDWIKTNIAYEIGSSQATTTAGDVLKNHAGVCRDFAHLGIALCRALNIPARFVFGHVEFPEPPPDFHALFEAYLGGQWILFDPTKMAPIDKIVRIGTGVDAKDVAFATLYGAVQMDYMKPLVRDHVEGQDALFADCEGFIGSERAPRGLSDSATERHYNAAH
jgi:transglutaminase-like putative cysteine protease